MVTKGGVAYEGPGPQTWPLMVPVATTTFIIALPLSWAFQRSYSTFSPASPWIPIY